MSEPQTLQAPKADIELASKADPIVVKADPAPKQDVDAVASSIGLDLGVKGPLGVDASVKADAKLTSDRERDRNIRQWSPDWVQYDEYYRPVIMNPYHERVRIVYIYDNRPRIVWIDPLSRIVLEVAQFAAYSFTAVVATAANIVNAAVDTAANVAVGSFFGGGFIPAFGQPLPPPPPPVLRYDNVPVLVNYSNARYEPFRVRRIVDVGDYLDYITNRIVPDFSREVRTALEGLWSSSSVAGSDTSHRQVAISCQACELPDGLAINNIAKNMIMIMLQDFMDPWTFNQKNLMKCCKEFLLPGGKQIPFCAYNSVGYREQAREQLNAMEPERRRARKEGRPYEPKPVVFDFGDRTHVR